MGHVAWGTWHGARRVGHVALGHVAWGTRYKIKLSTLSARAPAVSRWGRWRAAGWFHSTKYGARAAILMASGERATYARESA